MSTVILNITAGFVAIGTMFVASSMPTVAEVLGLQPSFLSDDDTLHLQ